MAARRVTISDIMAAQRWGNEKVEIHAWLCRIEDKHGFVYKACPKHLPDGRTCLRKVDSAHDCVTSDPPLDCYRFSFFICDGTGVMRVSIFQAAATLFSMEPASFAKLNFESQRALAEALLDRQFGFLLSLTPGSAVVKKVDDYLRRNASIPQLTVNHGSSTL